MIQILKKTLMAKRSVIQPSHVHIAHCENGLSTCPSAEAKAVRTATH